MKQFQNFLTALLVIGLFLSSFSFDPREQQQISFQEFKYMLLEPGLVDHIVVSNKSGAKIYVSGNETVAKIYVRNSPLNQTDSEVVQGTLTGKGSGGQYKYFFNIESVVSFKEKLEEAQEAIGIDPHDFVPVTYSYSFEMVWYRELMKVALTLLLLGSLLYMERRMQGGFGGGKDARGKAHVTKVDKNAKNKVSSRDGCT